MESKTTTLSLRVPVSILEQFGMLAEATGRSRNHLAVQAMQKYIEQESWQVKAIMEAIKEMDEGKIASDEELATIDNKWGFRKDENAN